MQIIGKGKQNVIHRSLKSDSHKRFCTRGRPFILGHGESKEILSGRLPQQKLPCKSPGGRWDSNPGPLEMVIRLNFSTLYGKKSTFLPYRIKKDYPTFEVDTFKVMLLLS